MRRRCHGMSTNLDDDLAERVVVVTGRGVACVGQFDELRVWAPWRGSPATPSSLTTSDSLPRISRIGISRLIAACSSLSMRANGSSSGLVRNAGSQCQYQRPSRRRRFFFNPSGLRGLVRCGRYAATASAASSSVSKPCDAAGHEVADARAAVLLEPRHDVDEHQLGRPARGRPRGPRRYRSARPCWRRSAPRAGRSGTAPAACRRTAPPPSSRRSGERSLSPCPRLSRAIDVVARVGEDLARVLPGVPVLAAAVQHQDRRALSRLRASRFHSSATRRGRRRRGTSRSVDALLAMLMDIPLGRPVDLTLPSARSAESMGPRTPAARRR